MDMNGNMHAFPVEVGRITELSALFPADSTYDDSRIGWSAIGK